MKLLRFALVNLTIVLILSFTATLFAVLPSLAQTASLPHTDLVLIDEVRLDPATGGLTQVVLTDGGIGATSLQGLVVVFLTDSDGTIIAAYDLENAVTDEDGAFSLAAADADLAVDSETLQAAKAVALYTGAADDFAAGSAPSTTNLQDLVIFTLANAEEVLATHLPVPESAVSSQPVAAARAADASVAANAGVCGSEATLIHAIQGEGDASPLLGQTVNVEGIVVGDFQNTKTQLRGFFVQEEAANGDSDPQTSEGIFVFDSGFNVDVTAGDLVRVRGLVHEYNTMTELKRVESVVVCSGGHTLEPATVTLPEAVDGDLEQYEGMLVHIASEMTVAQNYFLGRYGQMTLAAPGEPGARIYQPTNLFPPDSPEAQALADENARRLLVLDDGRDLSALGDNPNPVPYLGAPPPAVIRAGDTVTNLVGVLDYGRIDSAPGNEVGLDYRLHPIEAPIFTTANPRTDTPPTVGGALKVASFNVLNYFNGDGQGSGFPTPRGAQTPSEFQRQRAKIIAALQALDADVVGLMEIENDGYGPDSAIQDLVNGLNETLPAGVSYAAIDPRLPRLGEDEITVGILYKTNTITPTGPALTLDIGAFDQMLADGGRSRQPLVQTFVDERGERFTVAVNHFKSKRPGETMSGGNADSGNGTGAWNERRTEAAQDLVDWLATDPTASGDPDFLIIGDLNSYAQETPITTIEDGGYVNLLAHFHGDDAYSYVFDGQVGYLDHALASTALVSQTTGAVDWHINTDEPKVLDYEERFNPPGYYSATAFRASDHDPVLIGFDLAATSQLTDTEPVTDTTEITDTTDITNTTDTTDVTGTTDITDTTGAPAKTDTDTEGGTDTGGSSDGITAATTYVVRAGDTLSQLARRYSVTIAALAQANGLSIHGELPIGRQLTIPPVQRNGSCWRTIVGQTGETVADLAARYNADADRLAQFNGLAGGTTPIAGIPVCLPNIYASGYTAPPSSFYYTVQPGDTLSTIARRYSVSIWHLRHSNGLHNIDYIEIGQRLLVSR